MHPHLCGQGIKLSACLKQTNKTCCKMTNPPNLGEVFGDANGLPHVPHLCQLSMPSKRITSIGPHLYFVIIMENIASILEAIVISKCNDILWNTQNAIMRGVDMNGGQDRKINQQLSQQVSKNNQIQLESSNHATNTIPVKTLHR